MRTSCTSFLMRIVKNPIERNLQHSERSGDNELVQSLFWRSPEQSLHAALPVRKKYWLVPESTRIKLNISVYTICSSSGVRLEWERCLWGERKIAQSWSSAHVYFQPLTFDRGLYLPRQLTLGGHFVTGIPKSVLVLADSGEEKMLSPMSRGKKLICYEES